MKQEKFITEQALCNACPKVIFAFERKFQNATVIKPNGDRENYIWEIKKNTITCYNIDAKANLNSFFSSGYKCKLTKKKKHSELELLNQKTKSLIILRK